MIDCGGRTLMPGLIDSHVHVILSEVNIRFLEGVPLTLDDRARRAADARHAQPRLHHACATPAAPTGASRPRSSRAIFPGPRLFIAGAAIGPTGGHSDPRRRTDFGTALPLLQRHALRHAVVRRRVRGAQGRARADAPGRRPHQDHDVGRRRLALRSARQPAIQPGEVAAAVEEAQAFGRYVCAHAYTPEAITRAAHGGVRTIEHGNLIDDAVGQADGREGHVPDRQPRRLLRHARARGRIRHDAATCWRRTIS